MKPVMKLLLGIAVVAAIVLQPEPVDAGPIVVASYQDFTRTPVKVTKGAWSATGGGYASFTVADAPAATGDPLLDALMARGSSFVAMCLEPDETINRNTEYRFEIVPLALAPTSPRSGPMGALGELWVENILANLGADDLGTLFDSLAYEQERAFQAAVYEAGYEDTAAFAFNSGSAVQAFGSAGAELVAYTASALDGITINAYGLINLGPRGAGPNFKGQDFLVYTRTEQMPNPGPLGLLGLGLLGLGLIRKVG